MTPLPLAERDWGKAIQGRSATRRSFVCHGTRREKPSIDSHKLGVKI